jgi:uncharacterized protein (TIGR00297 family)
LFSAETLVLAVIVSALLASLGYFLGTLDLSGGLAAFFVGFMVLYFPNSVGWFGTLVFFFVTSSVWTKLKHSKKLVLGLVGRGGMRGWRNVISNGLVPSSCALAFGLTRWNVFALGFLGSLAVSTADTWATEIGVPYGGTPRLITNLKVQVTPGTSGGISLLGEAVSILGSLLIAIVGVILGAVPSQLGNVGLVFLTGMVGSNFDSLLGATVQSQYICPNCGARIETPNHCKAHATLIGGQTWMDNNMVNFAATTIGVLAPLLVAVSSQKA